MRHSSSKDPIASWPPPILEPESVRPAREAFDRLADQWARTKGELRDARDGEKAAAAEQPRVDAEAFAAGKEPAKERLVDVAKAKTADLERRLAGLSVALHDAGNELTAGQEDAKAEWLAALNAEFAKQVARFEAALTEAAAAAEEAGRAYAGRKWVEEFEAGPAVAGMVTKFHGGAYTFPTRAPSANSYPTVTDLLHVARKAVEPPAPRPASVGPPFGGKDAGKMGRPAARV